MVALDPGRHEVSLAHATRAHSINNSVVLGKHCRGPTVSVGAVDILIVQDLVTWSTVRDQGKKQWWPERVVCTHLDAVASCRYLCSRSTYSDRGQASWQGPGPTMGTLAAVEALVSACFPEAAYCPPE